MEPTANAVRSAWGYRTQAVNFENEALTKRATAGAINPFGSAAGSLLGSAASDCLPEPLFRLLQGNDGDVIDWVAGSGVLRALYRRMGPRHAESRLLIVFPVTAGGR